VFCSLGELAFFTRLGFGKESGYGKGAAGQTPPAAKKRSRGRGRLAITTTIPITSTSALSISSASAADCGVAQFSKKNYKNGDVKADRI